MDIKIDRWSKYLAKSGNKTSLVYKWKAETFEKYKSQDGRILEVDAFDGGNWHKSRVLERMRLTFQGRVVEVVKVGYKIYKEKEESIKRDELKAERINFEGFSSWRYTYIPWYSPKIKTGKIKIVDSKKKSDNIKAFIDDIVTKNDFKKSSDGLILLHQLLSKIVGEPAEQKFR